MLRKSSLNLRVGLFLALGFASLAMFALRLSAEPPPSIAGLKLLGDIQPRTSREIVQSPWAIETGSLRDDILAQAAEIGVKWVRVSANWPSIELEQGQYDWTETDRAFKFALENGITPLVTLKGASKFYCPPSKPIGKGDADDLFGRRTAPPTDNPVAMAAWLKFVEATVRHYDGRIQYWEIWNEPNNAGYWGAAPNAEDYGRLLRETATVIKQVQPTAKLVAGATAGLVPNFTQDYLGAGVVPGMVDIITFHSYGEIPEDRYPKALRVWPIVREFDPAIQLWQGECAFPSHSSTRGWRGTGPWGLNIQAKWLLRQAFSDIFLCRAAVSTYGKLFSDGDREESQIRSSLTEIDQVLGYYVGSRGGSTRVRGNGVNEKCLLENPSLKPKPGFVAYRNLCSLIDARYNVSADVQTRFEVEDPGVFLGVGHDDAFPSVPLAATFKTSDGQPLIAYWLPWRPQENIAQLARITLRIAGAKFTEPVLVDLLDGRVYELTQAEGTDGGLVFTGLPLADYPLAIAERAHVGIRAPSGMPGSSGSGR